MRTLAAARRVLWSGLAIGVALGISMPSSAIAQGLGFSGLSSLGGVGRIPTEKHFEDRFEESNVRLGVLRLLPSIGVNDARFVTNSRILTNDLGDIDARFEDPDLTASIVAGTRAYVRTGPHVVWAAQALPTYVWWAEDVDRRRLNGRFGLGAFVYVRRLSFELSERSDELQTFFDQERPELTTTRQGQRRLALSYRFPRRVTVSTSFVERRVRGNVDRDDLELASFNRRQQSFQIGAAYSAPGGLVLQLSQREVLSRFGPEARRFSSTESITALSGLYRRNRFETRATLAERRSRPRGDSVLIRRTTNTGSLLTLWRFPRRITLNTSINRSVRLALDRDFTRSISDRFLLQLTARLRHFHFSLTYGGGKESFEPISGSLLEREDDVDFHAATITLPTLPWISPTFSISRWKFDSNLDRNDREITTVGFNVRLKLRLPRIPTSLRLPTERLRFGSEDLSSNW